MTRTLGENGFFNELRVSNYSKESEPITPEILGTAARTYVVAPIPQMELSFNDNKWQLALSTLENKKRNVCFTSSSFVTLMAMLGISEKNIFSLPVDLIIYNFTKLRETQSMVILELDGEVVSNVFDTRAEIIPFATALEAMSRTGKNYNNVLISDSNCRVMELSEFDFEVAKEKLKVGWFFDIEHHKKGTKISSMGGTFRLVCSNGAVVPYDASSLKYSKSRDGDVEEGFSRFLDRVYSIGTDRLLELAKANNQWLVNTFPNNNMLINMNKVFKKSVDQDFADVVITWPEEERKGTLKFGALRDSMTESAHEAAEAFLKSINNDYGNCFDILNRATLESKVHSVSSQIKLQNYVGSFLKEFALV